MTLKNPGSESAANQLPGLTPEIVVELNSGRMKVEQLNELQLRQMLEDEDTVEAPTGTPAPAPADAKVPAAAAPVSPSPKVEPKPGEAASPVDGEEYRKKADELNTAKQKLETRESELARVRTQLEALQKANTPAPVPKKTIDEEGYFESVEERIARLEAENKSIKEQHASNVSTQVKTLEDEHRAAAVDREFLDIEFFQMRSKGMGMDLKTERPIRVIDAEVSRLEKLVGEDGVRKLKTDEAYRAEMAKKGIALPQEWEKHDVIMRAYDFKRDKKYPTFTSAFADFFELSGLQKRQIANLSLEVQKATTEKLIQSSNETAMLPAESGAGASSHTVLSSKWDKQKAATWMSQNPNPKTPEERAIQYEILEWMETQPDIE